MDKICLQELINRLTEDYIPTTMDRMVQVLEGSEFSRGKLAGVAMIIDSLERIIEDKEVE